MKQKFKDLAEYLERNKIFILSALIYWILIFFSTIFFVLIGFRADSYLVFYIYEAFALCIALVGILIYKYFIGLINSKDEILLTLNLVTISVILLSIPGSFILMAIGAQLIERLPNFRTFGNEGDWINFIGIVIAGTITMLGITYTIRNEHRSRETESKKKEHELAIISTPVLILDVADELSKKSRYCQMGLVSENTFYMNFYGSFYIKNTSDNFAIIDNFELKNAELINTLDENKTRISVDDILFYDFEVGDLVPPKTALAVRYDLKCSMSNFDSIALYLQLTYSDFMSVNKYSIESDFSFFINVFDQKPLDNQSFDVDVFQDFNTKLYIEVIYRRFINKFRKV